MYNEFDIVSDETIAYVARAMEDCRVFTVIQGIHKVDDVDSTLYGECLARMSSTTGKVYSARDFISALDLLGATTMLDHYMLKAVLDHLERAESIIKCNTQPVRYRDGQALRTTHG